MRVTWGKVIWIFSFVIFLVVAYNMNTFERLWDIVIGQDTIEQVAEYNPFEQRKTREPATESIADTTGISGLGLGGSGTAEAEEPIVAESEIDVELYVKIERMAWELEQHEEEITELKVEIAELTSDKDTTIGNLIAIISALSPLLLPIITRKFGNHKKEILMRKAS